MNADLFPLNHRSQIHLHIIQVIRRNRTRKGDRGSIDKTLSQVDCDVDFFLIGQERFKCQRMKNIVHGNQINLMAFTYGKYVKAADQ